MAVKKTQLSVAPEQDFLCGQRPEGGDQSMWTPRVTSQPVQCWMAPVKPRRRRGSEPAWVRMMRDGALLDEYAQLTLSPLRSCPIFGNMWDDSHEGYIIGNLEDAMRALLVSEGDEFVNSPLRLCPNFEETSDDEWKNICNIAVDFVSQEPTIVPALMWH